MRRITVAFALALGICALAPAAQATPLTWTFFETKFSGGATATGSFEFDTSTSTLSNVSFQTSKDADFDGASYSAVPSVLPPSPTSLFFVTGDDSNLLLLAMDDPLTDAGGTLPFEITEFTCTNSTCLDANPIRSGTGFITTLDLGDVDPTNPSPVPEPSSIILLCTGSLAVALRRLGVMRAG